MTEYFIYKIYCKDETITDIYIGSTKDIQIRWNIHKSNCNNENNKEYNNYKYQFIRDNGGIENWNIIELEKLVCDKDQALIRERYWIETLQTNLNKVIPTRTHIEYYNDNKEKIIEKNKNYYENNKDKLCEKKKEYYNDNKDKLCEKNKNYRENNKKKISEKNKNYRENNKDKLCEKNKNYRENNKKKINKKINCECGGKYTSSHKSQHFKTKLHQSFIALSLEITK